MRDVLEAVLRHPDGIDADDARRDHALHEAVLAEHGPVLAPDVAQVRAGAARRTRFDAGRATAVRQRRVACRSRPDDDARRACSARLAPGVLRSRRASRSSPTRRPADGRDILAASANNLYAGVSMADLEGFEERYGLNSRLVKTGRRALVEEVYRVGGRYGAAIARIVSHLEARLPFATPAMRRRSRRCPLLPHGRRRGPRARTTSPGSPTRTRRSTRSTGSSRCTSTRAAARARGKALVYHVNREKTDAIARIAAHAQWFEDHMPYAPEYRREPGAGRHGARHRRRHRDRRRRPDDADRHQPAQRRRASARSTAASRVSLANVVEAYDKSLPPRVPRASSRGTPTRPRGRSGGAALAGELTTNLHEVVGHGSGKVSDRLDGHARRRCLQEQLLDARGDARRSRRALLRRRSGDRRARPGRRGRPRRARRAPSTRATRGTRSCSCGGSARAPRSRKTTCATARRSCTG